MGGWRQNGTLLAAKHLEPIPDVAKLSAGILPQLQAEVIPPPTFSGNWKDKTSNASSALPPLEVRPSPSKGLGLFALEPISAYTKVLEDDALLSLAKGENFLELWKKYCLLQPEFKQVFDELSFPSEVAEKERSITAELERRGHESSKAQAMARVHLRWQANSFKTGSKTWLYSLFPVVSRINHSCTPNACAHYRESGAQIVYALRDIKAGEEVEITYFDITMPFSDRQTQAQSWGFKCSCPACSNTGELANTEYEQHLSYVHQHFSGASSNMDSDSRAESIRNAISISQSSEYPWLVLTLPKLYLSCFNLELGTKGRKAKARVALEKVLEWEEKTTGTESSFSQQRRRKLIEFDKGDLDW